MTQKTPFITVVSGLPRSGTSLMMQMLHGGGLAAVTDEQRTADDDNPRGYFEFERVKQIKSDKGWLDDAKGKAVKIIHLLLMDLPTDREYRVIFMQRDLDEVVKSQAVMLQRSGKSGGGLDPAKLKQIYQAQLTQVKAWLAERPNFKVMPVSYADLIQSPADHAAQINEFLGGHLTETGMISAVDPSLYRNRSK